MANRHPTRRQTLAGLAGLVAPMLATSPADATPERLAAAIARITGGAAVREGRVKLDLPPLAENGLSVPLAITVDSPMTTADHVKAIHVLAEKNPIANIASYTLSPRSGRAWVATSVRLADTQRVVVLAAMSDGSFWSGTADIIVTISACIDGG